MSEPFSYDRVTKDIFFQDRPRLLNRLVGGKPVREIVNSELPKTLERRADMVMLVDPDELHHLEFQSTNYRALGYRQGVDCFLLAERYKKRRIVQTVIYFGEPAMRMAPYLDVGAARVEYRLIDIREFDAMEIADGGTPADLVLATLGRGGEERLRELLARIYALPPEARNRALAQVSALTGLRRTTETFKMEMNRMAAAIDIFETPLLREMGDRTAREMLSEGLETRFGKLPDWAVARIGEVSIEDTRRLLRASYTAPTLESLFTKKRAGR